MKTIKTLSILIFILMLCLPAIVHAQLDDPGGDPAAPIDGGLSILLAAGVGYGVKKIRDSRKKHATDKQEVIEK